MCYLEDGQCVAGQLWDGGVERGEDVRRIVELPCVTSNSIRTGNWELWTGN